MMLSVGLLILAMDPTLSLYKKKKSKTIDESEEYGPARISLSSAVPVDSVVESVYAYKVGEAMLNKGIRQIGIKHETKLKL